MKILSLFGLAVFTASCFSDGARGPLTGGGAAGSGVGGAGVAGGGGMTSGTGGITGTGGVTASGSGGATGAGGRRSGGGVGGLGTGGASVSGGSSGVAGGGGTMAGVGGQPPGHTNPLTQVQIDSFVTAHNQARAGSLSPQPSPALPRVTWDAILADVAYNYLKKCQDQALPVGLVDHNANRTSDYAALGGGSDYVGENIFASSANTVTAAEAVSLWMAEAPSFNYAVGDFGTAGHYTQVVWRASVRIGCAIFNCPTTLMFHDSVLCDYAPGGNIIGQKPY